MKNEKTPTLPQAEHSLGRHFGKLALQNLITASRTFPLAARVDVQSALEKLFLQRTNRLLGVHTQFHHETMTVAHLMGDQHYPVMIGPLAAGGAAPGLCLGRDPARGRIPQCEIARGAEHCS